MATQTMRNTAVLAAIHTHYLTNSSGVYEIKPNDYALVTFAPLLGGILLCLVAGILLGVYLLMREKKKRIAEATSLANLPWLDTLEVFAVSDRESVPAMFLPLPNGPTTPSPPPAYDTVVKVNEKDEEAQQLAKEPAHPVSPLRKPTSGRLPPDDLPSYDVAVKMDGHI